MLRASVVALLIGLANTASAEEPPRPDLDPEFAEFFGSVEFEGSLFADDPQFSGQNRDTFSVAAQPSLLMEWAGGDVAFKITPFVRWDAADDDRSHYDLREAKFDVRAGEWDITAGFDTVFWGKTEAVHLVDIINSDDGVEGIDDEDKLGQPMLRVSRLTEVGTFSGFWLPVFRKPTEPGFGGRLRGPFPVDDDGARIEAAGEEYAQSFALRYANTFDAFDIGASAFWGVSRDAAFEPGPTGFVPPTDFELTPVYDNILQLGFDGQYTSGAALWKLEVIGRFNQRNLSFEREDYVATTGGIEYTLYQILETPSDLGLILEGAYDSRGEEALTTFEEDVIAGVRWTLNDEADTAVLLTGTVDVGSGSSALRLEAERRIAEGWKLEVEGQAFVNIDEEELEAPLEDDSFLKVKLSYFW